MSRECVHVYCKYMSYGIQSLKPTRKRDVKGGEERIKSILRKVEVNLKCYLCNSLRGSMIKFCSCNKAKVYFGSVLETLIHDQLSLWALWWHSDYGGSGWQRRYLPHGARSEVTKGWDSNIPFRVPPWHSFCEDTVP